MLRKTSKLAPILCCVIGACLFATAAHAEKLKARGFEKNRQSMGVVLLDANWGRQWGCGGYENAQLTSFRFEIAGSGDINANDEYSSILAQPESRLLVNPVFLNYGFLVRPGTYGLSEITIKAARSKSDVFYIVAEKDKLVVDDVYVGGTFTVKAGEVVYIGNFGLDCLEEPMLWRYYTEGGEDFDRHVAEYKKTFSFLRNSDIVYRLFESDVFGTDYAPPSGEEHEEPDSTLSFSTE